MLKVTQPYTSNMHSETNNQAIAIIVLICGFGVTQMFWNYRIYENLLFKQEMDSFESHQQRICWN